MSKALAGNSRIFSTAHAAGITHRDIKPDNIMVREDGYVKMLIPLSRAERARVSVGAAIG